MSAQTRLEHFGSLARYYCAGLPTVSAIVCDPSAAIQALAAAPRRREVAEPFFAGILLDERRAGLAAQFAHLLLEQATTLDQRRAALDQLAAQAIVINNAQISQMQLYPPEVIKTLRDFLLLGDAMLVRSYAERRVIEQTLGRARANVGVFPGVDTLVPAIERRKPSSIVIWGPRKDAKELSLLAFAAEELHAPVVAVAAGGKLVGSRGRVVGVVHAAEVLADAAVVIDASLSDPASAIALADQQLPIVISSTSGADEYVDGAVRYDPWNWQSVLSALSKAMAGTRPVVRSRGMGRDELQAVLDASVPEIPERRPLVSILIPTYNRRQVIDQQLSRLCRQTYPNIEIIVANDAGEAIDDVVAKYPNVRLINCERNGGAARATNAAAQAALGEYICTLADDDVDFPDFVARLVDAAERTGAVVVHGNIIHRIMEKTKNGYRALGFRSHYDGHMDRSETLGVVNISVQGVLFHRSVFDSRPFYYDEIPLVADAELIMGTSRDLDYVHVDFVVGESETRTDGSQQSSMLAVAMLEQSHVVYERYPTKERPWLQARRQASYDAVETMLVKGGGFQPAMRLPEGS